MRVKSPNAAAMQSQGGVKPAAAKPAHLQLLELLPHAHVRRADRRLLHVQRLQQLLRVALHVLVTSLQDVVPDTCFKPLKAPQRQFRQLTM